MKNGTIRLDVALTIDSTIALSKADCAVAVIDVLRATTTIARAVSSGATAVYPVAGIEAARSVAKELGDALLCGERLGVKPEGFDLGNSPSEYSKERVGGRNIVIATTNGTKALDRYSGSRVLVAAGLVNASAVADYLLATGKDIILVSAGQDGAFGAEDAICAGMIAERIRSKAKIEYTDPAWLSITAYRACVKDIPGAVKQCDHAVYLIAEGFGDDVSYCCQVDALNVVPVAKERNGRMAVIRA